MLARGVRGGRRSGAAQRRTVSARARRVARSDARRGSQPLFFDPDVDPIVTSKTPGPGRDILQASANNLYCGVDDGGPGGRSSKRYPLNSRLVKRDGALVEEVYRVGGTYDRTSARSSRHLRGGRAVRDAGDGARRCEALIRFYQTGRGSATASPTTSPGSRIATRPSTRSTGSSRSTWTRAA